MINKIFGVVCFALVIYCALLTAENKTLKEMANDYSRGYDELLNKPGPGGNRLASLVKPGSVGVLFIGEDAVACAMVNRGLLDKAHKH